MMVQPAYTSLLVHPKHGSLLVQDSAIAPALVEHRGYQSLPQPEDLIDRGFSKAQAKAAPALGIPLWDVHGQRCGWQIRPDCPRQMQDGKVFKYEMPKGDHLILDVHPSVQPRIGDPHEPLWIAEGVRKGDSLASKDLCTIALIGGVWGFRGTNAHGGKVILPDWEHVALNGREVVVVFDSDLATKPGVQAALKALWALLRSRHARPVRVQWTEAFQQEKWGVDDFFAQGYSLDELRAMIPPMGPLPLRGPPPRNGQRAPDGAPPEPPLPYSDYTNAYAFVRDHGQDVRYCHPWNVWLVWTGTHWQRDLSGAVMRLAKQTVKRLARQAEHLDDEAAQALMAHIKASLSTAKLKALIENAQSEEGIPVQPEDLDTDPWVLNVANGTLDLRTGTLRPHARADLLTFALAVAYDPAATAPTWEAFLARVMADNDNLLTFLQRAIGYALTGVIREHVLLILWGRGRNGKSTFLNILRKLLGAYAMKAPSELLMVSHNDRHPTERADLWGKRLVAAIETEQGRKLAEVFVKEATGGDPIRARRMREDFWEFQPTHKVLLATNHKPVITGTDTAIWERLKLVPFTVTIPEGERDTTLPEKLEQELPGILNWGLQGCLVWQQDGLGEPDEVRQATAGYRSEMDVLGQFIDECCLTDSRCRVKASDLYEAYQHWCHEQGELAEVQRTWGMRLTERGYDSGKVQGRSWWKGIALLQVDERGRDRLPTQPTENKEINPKMSA
jgi:putative DNA primase/helicase